MKFFGQSLPVLPYAVSPTTLPHSVSGEHSALATSYPPTSLGPQNFLQPGVKLDQSRAVGEAVGAPVVGDAVGFAVVGDAVGGGILFGDAVGVKEGGKVVPSQCAGVVPHHPC